MTESQSVNACWVLGLRPLCACCGGGKKINHKLGKAHRRKQNVKSKRSPGKPSRLWCKLRQLKHHGGYRSKAEYLEWEVPDKYTDPF